jgi:hypothetical protein
MLIGQRIGSTDKVLLKDLSRGAVDDLFLDCLLGITLPSTLPLVDSGGTSVDFLLKGAILFLPVFELLPFLVFA